MDKYLTVTAQGVMNISQLLSNYYRTQIKLWKPEADRMIESIAKDSGKQPLRLFQTFFENPEECLSGYFKTQVLEEKDMLAMYPHYESSIRSLSPTQYYYIFVCNGALNDGKSALVMHQVIETKQ